MPPVFRAQEEAVEHWNGIGFMLGGHQFVAAMGEVVEILHLPRFTVIPGVKTWMQVSPMFGAACCQYWIWRPSSISLAHHAVRVKTSHGH